ncbi:MAG: Crp/Fnr family transcriptional regulator [Alistipes sp.]|jgi:CRP-like cAMP-binding protein|nr:Crp/Fnr family transcriptional regulator [Alistipes sp.]
METLKRLINAEGEYRMRDQTVERFIGLMEEVKLKRNQVLVPYNTVDDNVYMIKKGIIRTVYFDGFKEVTFAFALPGTIKISWYSYYKKLPSFNKYVACCDSVVMKITKAQFTDLVKESHDFAQWVAAVFTDQFFNYEKKRDVMNGDARERFEALIANRPEIMENLSDRIIASYIGVSPQYLCKLKKEFSHRLK